MKNTFRLALAASVTCLAGAAMAHVTVAPGEAAIGGAFRAVFTVPHGCAGAETARLRIRIPEGFIGVKPQPKPGWELDKITGDYARPQMLFGAEVTGGLVEVSWSGSLPDDEFDEFILRGTLAGDLEPGAMLYFPVVQECAGDAVERWITIPAADDGGDEPDNPAPGVRLRAAP